MTTSKHEHGELLRDSPACVIQPDGAWSAKVRGDARVVFRDSIPDLLQVRLR
jgi:hypothetical protein